MNYYRDNNRNTNQRYERAPIPAQAPYRPPGHHDREVSQPTTNEDLRNLLMTIAKHQDTCLESLEQTTKVFSESIRTQFKGVRAHLEDLES